jgi:hypothetical protein
MALAVRIYFVFRHCFAIMAIIGQGRSTELDSTYGNRQGVLGRADGYS